MLKQNLGKKTVSRGRPGFTLVEILVVVIILGILAGLIIPRIADQPEKARRTKAKMQIESLETALKLYKLDNGYYPTTDQGLEALVNKPTSGKIPNRWRDGGYLEKGRIPADPWDRNFLYLSPGVHNRDFDLYSLGADGEVGGEDADADVTNWGDDN